LYYAQERSLCLWLKQLKIPHLWAQFTFLYTVDDLYDLVIDRGGDACFLCLFTEHAVYRVDFTLFAFLDVLQHARLEGPMLFHGKGDQMEGYPLLYRT